MIVLNYQKIYEKLGYLFYALAACDGRVRIEEEDALQKIVESMWVPYENSTDEFEMEAAEYILISFDYLRAEGMESEDAFRVFEDYYREHERAFSKTMKRKILSTAYSLVDAYHSQNFRESVMIRRLETLLGF